MRRCATIPIVDDEPSVVRRRTVAPTTAAFDPRQRLARRALARDPATDRAGGR